MILNDDTFLLYTVKHYDNPGCTGMKEFQDDLKRFKYIKRLLKQYEKTGEVGERLILNHIILLHNVFAEATVPLLFFKFEEKYWPQIKTFLVFLEYLPDDCKIGNKNESDIPLDQKLIFKLRKI
jgi:hypothetical protein